MTHPGVTLPVVPAGKPRRVLDHTSALACQLQYLLKTLTKANHASHYQELLKLLLRFGEEAYRLLLELLVKEVTRPAATTSEGSAEQLKSYANILGQQVVRLPKFPNFISIASGLVSAKDLNGRPNFLQDLAKTVSMPLPVQLSLGLAFSHSCEPEVQAEGQRFLKNKLGEITPTAVKTLPESVVHHLLYYIQSTEVFTEQAKILMQLESLRQSLLSLYPLNLPPKELQQVKRRRDEVQATLPSNCLDELNLAGILEELGPGCTANAASLRAVMDHFPQITPQAVGRVIGMMAMHHSSHADLALNTEECQQALFHAMKSTGATVSTFHVWDVQIFVQVLQERGYDGVSFWHAVLRSLDYDGLKLSTLRGLNLLVSVMNSAGRAELPVQPFLGDWRNSEVQLTILSLCLQAPPDVVSFQTPRVVPYDESPWASIDLVETLLNLATPRLHSRVLYLFEARPGDKLGRTAGGGPLTKCPDLLLVVLLLTRPHNTILRRELVQKLVAEYLKRSTTHDKELLMRTATENIDILCQGLADAFLDNPQLAESILNVAIDGKWIEPLMHRCPSAGLLSQIILLSGIRGGPSNRLGGPQWLRKVLEGEVSVVPDLSTLAQTLVNRIEQEREIPNVLELLAVLSDTSVPGLSPAQKQHAGKLCDALKKPAAEPSAGGITAEIDEEATAYFAKMWSGELEVQTLIDMLARYKNNPADELHHSLHLCMINKLFEQLGYLEQYPMGLLMKTAKLFGGLIGQGVLSHAKLAPALKFVLQNLAKPPHENMKKFCIGALEEFKHRLPEWQQYCTLLERIRGIDQMVDGIGEYLRPSADGHQQVPIQAQAGQIMAETPNVSVEDAQNEIHALMSKLVPTNVDVVAFELRRYLEPETYNFFADFIVVKRASLESNPHKLLMALLEKLGNKDVDTAVVQATYTAIKVLLASEKIRTNTSERSLLKNLGSWLGLQTIARNKPLMARDLDLKGLLYEAFLCGRLIAVVPFVAKVLEHSANSKVFKPPNPWLMGILSLLVDLYQLQDLKLTLKFEVEVLCKNINIPINDLVDTKGARAAQKEKLEGIRKELQARGELEQSTDFNPGKRPQNPMEGGEVRMTENMRLGLWGADAAKALPGDTRPHLPPASGDWTAQIQEMHRPESLLELVNVSAAPAPNQALKAVVADAIDIALKGPLKALVERSATVSCITTKELVIKDYATEADDSKLVKAGGQMSRCLASHLAMVSCKDALKQAMKAHLKLELPEMDQNVLDTLVKDNLDLSVTVVEKVAAETSAKQLESELVDHMKTRKAYHEARKWPHMQDQPFEVLPDDQKENPFVRTLPEPLRPRNGLLYTQKSVYEEFAKLQASRSAEKEPPFTQEQSRALEKLETILNNIEAETQKHYQTVPPVDGNRSNVLSLTQVTFTTESQSPQHINIRKLLCNIPNLIKDDTAVLFARHVFGKVFALSDRILQAQKNPQPIGLYVAMLLNEVCLFILQSARDKVEAKVVEELTKLFVKSQKKWLNKDIAVNFIRLHLIDVPEFDRHLTKALTAAEDPARYIVEFAGSIVQKCLVDEKLTSQKNLRSTLEALDKIAKAARMQQPQAAPPAAAEIEQPSPAPAQAVPASPVTPVQPPTDATQPRPPQTPQQQQQQQQPSPVTPQLQTPPPQQQQPAPLRAPHEPLSSPTTPISLAKQASGEAPPVGLRRPTVRAPSLVTTRQGGQDTRDRVFQLLCDWVLICTKRQQMPGDGEQRQPQTQATEFVSKLQQAGLLKADNMLDKFFALLMEISVEDYCSEVRRCSKEEVKGKGKVVPNGTTHPQIFQSVDAFSDLMVLLIKCCAWGDDKDRKEEGKNAAAEVALVNKVVSVVSKVLIHNHDYHFASTRDLSQVPLQEGQVPQDEFKQQPFFRFFSNLLLALNPSHEGEASYNTEMLVLFSGMFHHLAPSRVPGFAFGWLELIAHRIFMPKLLLKNEPGWPHFQRLLVDCLRFLEPSLRKVELTQPVKLFYKGTLKVLLVLLHDFPEFLCNYHFSFCDVIPQTCIQMRNVILSSFPRTMKLPDPFTPNLKVDRLSEIARPPDILSKYKEAMMDPKAAVTLQEVDDFLNGKAPDDWLAGLPERFLAPEGGVGKYNAPLINSIVLYIGVQSLGLFENDKSILESKGMDFFKYLSAHLCPEGRYLFVGSLANQLRYPNNHTHYFSCVVLHLFLSCHPDETQQEAVQEQVTRVLIERLIVNRPHPWGLLITFIELVKNPTYNFWRKRFIHSSEDITKLFESVGQSCVGPNKQG
ncbi:General negative regulator of transcription subunit 1 [Diplonema papillatum]|nr:General negative regulator of transcription subunit 1 [Diplonema papillatum]KAJ9453729.1 General negative regulator of transcription subunit 1 [Diplonema papillatum]